MLCPVCGKNLMPEKFGKDRSKYCPFCACRLPVIDDSFRALADYLIPESVKFKL